MKPYITKTKSGRLAANADGVVVAPLLQSLPWRVIVVKHGVLLRPDADALFMTAEPWDALPLLGIQDEVPLSEYPPAPRFTGAHVVIRRGKPNKKYPSDVKWVTRTKDHERLADKPDHVCGYDAGTSAINLAYHFGAAEILLLGYDMTGGRWYTGYWPHQMPRIPEEHFRRHMGPLKALAADARAKGIRIVNCSPISRVSVFEKQPLEAFL